MGDNQAFEPFSGRRATGSPGWAQAAAALRVVLVVVAVACGLWLIARLETVILLVVLSVFFAYLIAPLVELVERPFPLLGQRRTLSHGLAIGVVYLALAALLAVMLAWLVPLLAQQVTQLGSQAPAYIAAVQDRTRAFTDELNRLGLPPAARDGALQALGSAGRSLEETGRHAAMSLVAAATYLPWLILIPILGFFLLKDAQLFRETAICLLPAGRLRSNGAQLFTRINVALAAYIRAQLLACVIIGAVVTVGFAVLRVPYGVVLGAAAGLAEFIPLVGPVVVALSAALLAALHAPVLALWVLVFLAVVRVLEDYVIYPRLVGTSIHMHPLAIILAVLAGAELAGVAGVFLSVPVVAVLSAAYEQYRVYSGTAVRNETAVVPPRGRSLE